ncbi:MAG: hypothetical protein ACLR0P_06065 [Oscillospiraceae bacterium]
MDKLGDEAHAAAITPEGLWSRYQQLLRTAEIEVWLPAAPHSRERGRPCTDRSPVRTAPGRGAPGSRVRGAPPRRSGAPAGGGAHGCVPGASWPWASAPAASPAGRRSILPW